MRRQCGHAPDWRADYGLIDAQICPCDLTPGHFGNHESRVPTRPNGHYTTWERRPCDDCAASNYDTCQECGGLVALDWRPTPERQARLVPHYVADTGARCEPRHGAVVLTPQRKVVEARRSDDRPSLEVALERLAQGRDGVDSAELVGDELVLGDLANDTNRWPPIEK